MFTLSDVREPALERGHFGKLATYFKAGANAAWSTQFVDASGFHDIEKGEAWFTRKGLGPYALDAFTDGWCYGANH